MPLVWARLSIEKWKEREVLGLFWFPKMQIYEKHLIKGDKKVKTRVVIRVDNAKHYQETVHCF